ncbi:surface protease GP63 [Trypanosoma rangeli]|uniref:Surface protease GP63 n=1 Tax=Trypanosoma rangeli TaxID=5698 RepID=A0A422N0G3_TRYRA|nr:surface protease GP63 [Trypanosoma rangeli]RNE98951.1 surface protease GP63 [Trypanosoma rangeli]|eukprot:RNE98951.1 surface protease GP63 [Trypanosoma rangeli]
MPVALKKYVTEAEAHIAMDEITHALSFLQLVVWPLMQAVGVDKVVPGSTRVYRPRLGKGVTRGSHNPKGSKWCGGILTPPRLRRGGDWGWRRAQNGRLAPKKKYILYEEVMLGSITTAKRL